MKSDYLAVGSLLMASSTELKTLEVIIDSSKRKSVGRSVTELAFITRAAAVRLRGWAAARGRRPRRARGAKWLRTVQLTAAQVAERAGISRYTVMRLENGEGASLENLLRVARALGVLDLLAAAIDPYATDLGRLRAQESLPERVRPPRTRGTP